MTERRLLRAFDVVVEKRPIQAPAINQNEPRWRLRNSQVNARNPLVF